MAGKATTREKGPSGPQVSLLVIRRSRESQQSGPPGLRLSIRRTRTTHGYVWRGWGGQYVAVFFQSPTPPHTQTLRGIFFFKKCWGLNKDCNILTAPAALEIAVCRSRSPDAQPEARGPTLLAFSTASYHQETHLGSWGPLLPGGGFPYQIFSRRLLLIASICIEHVYMYSCSQWLYNIILCQEIRKSLL